MHVGLNHNSSLEVGMNQRKQYPFDSSGLKYKSMSDIMRLRRQWETYERVENYNFAVYNNLVKGDRAGLYYQFSSNEELNDYRNGQQQHMLKYPQVTFGSIADTYPAVNFANPPPTFVPQTIRQNASFQQAISSSENTERANDLAIYAYASTYNSQHVIQYIFPSNEEKMAYERAQQRVLTNTSTNLRIY